MLRPMVERCVLKGVSGTVVVLGAQGAGKVHTLLGDGVQSGLIKRVRKFSLLINAFLYCI
jgi:hypothetical protein